MKRIKLLAALTMVAGIFFSSCGDVEPIDPAITDDTDIQTSILTTAEVTNVTATSATAGGTITSDGGYAITARGVVWSTLHNPTIEDSKSTNGAGMGTFASQLTNLSQNTVYYVRAYATNSEGTSYGNEMIFATLTDTSFPVVTTTAATEIGSNRFTSGGNVSYDGGHPITARGVVYGTSLNPTIANSRTINGTGMGSFVSEVAALTQNTTYYVRAYATNSSGTSYGNQITVRTLTSQVDNTPAMMTANIDGVQYDHMQPFMYSAIGQDISVMNDGAPAEDLQYIKIQGTNNDGMVNSKQIELYIPDTKWAPGTYPLYWDMGFEMDVCWAKMIVFSTPDTRAIDIDGSITVTEFNLTTRRIKGTFQFTYEKLDENGDPMGTFEVTNGTFNYGLDDEYFD